MMAKYDEHCDPGRMRQLCRLRGARPVGKLLGETVDRFMKKVLAPRRKRLGRLAAAWAALLPDDLVAHSCLEGVRGGTLRVLVDSGPELAELDLMVREGLIEQLREMCPSVPLSRIRLVRGYWYHRDEEGNRIPEF